MFIQIPLVQFTIGLHLTQHFQMLLQMSRVYLSQIASHGTPEQLPPKSLRSRDFSASTENVSLLLVQAHTLDIGFGESKGLKELVGPSWALCGVGKRRNVES